MTLASDLESLFAPHSVPQPLAKLVEFSEQIGRIWYAKGFEIYPNVKRSGINTWSADRGFLDALFPFATANGSGSIYALWNEGRSEDPSAWPVIVFGDEGGVWIVAKDLLDLLALLTFDAEPMIGHDGVVYYRNAKTHEFSEGHKQYLEWLRNTFGIAPVDDADGRVSTAQTSLQSRFEIWMSAFVKE